MSRSKRITISDWLKGLLRDGMNGPSAKKTHAFRYGHKIYALNHDRGDRYVDELHEKYNGEHEALERDFPHIFHAQRPIDDHTKRFFSSDDERKRYKAEYDERSKAIKDHKSMVFAICLDDFKNGAWREFDPDTEVTPIDWPVDCQSCGACCQVWENQSINKKSFDDFDAIPKRLIGREGKRMWLKAYKNTRTCQAFEVKDGRCSCSIYDNRPNFCEGFVPGSSHCVSAMSIIFVWRRQATFKRDHPKMSTFVV